MIQKPLLSALALATVLWLLLVLSRSPTRLEPVKNVIQAKMNSAYSFVSSSFSLFEQKIDGRNRFEWYRKDFGKVPLENATKVSSLYAYEFPHEYTVTLTSRDFKGYRVYCRYLDEEGEEIGKPFESFTHPEYTVACEKRNGTAKIGVSPGREGPFVALPIVNRMQPRKYQLAMCVTPLYGSEPKWLMIIEMIEHYKLQGVEHFYMYIHNASIYDLKIVNDYVRTGEAEVHYLLERDRRTDDHWQMVHIADCLVRSRGESKWTIFADLDERLLMTNYNGTIRDYVGEVEDEKIAALQFRQQWVLKTELMPERYEGAKQITQWMPSHRWHNSTGIGSEGHTTKCIIDTSKVFEMWVHSVTSFFPGHKYYTKKLVPSEGIVRHYRDQSLGDWGRVWLKSVLPFGNLTNTNYPKRYLGELTKQVEIRADYVYGNEYE